MNENEEIPYSCDGDVQKDFADQPCHDEYVMLLLVKGKVNGVVDFCEKLKSDRLEAQDYKNIFGYAVVPKSQWDGMVQIIKSNPYCPKSVEKMLLRRDCDWLRFYGQEHYETCPRLYDLINEYNEGNIVPARWTEQFRTRLIREGVHLV